MWEIFRKVFNKSIIELNSGSASLGIFSDLYIISAFWAALYLFAFVRRVFSVLDLRALSF